MCSRDAHESRVLTLISAMKRNIVLKNEADTGIRVHIVGADEVECEYCTG